MEKENFGKRLTEMVKSPSGKRTTFVGAKTYEGWVLNDPKTDVYAGMF